MLLILGLSLYKWRRKINGWYKLAYSCQVKLCQQRQNENLSSWPLFLNTMLETAHVVVSVCVFLYSLTPSLWQNLFSSHPFFFFSQMSKHSFSAGLRLFSFFKCLLFMFFPFSSFEYESNFLHPYASSCSNRIGCLFSSPFLLFPSLWIPTSWGTAST